MVQLNNTNTLFLKFQFNFRVDTWAKFVTLI